MSKRRRSSKAASPPPLRTLGGRYWDATQEPLYCLLLLFPLVAVYEFGALILRPAAWPERELVAHGLIQALLGWVGATGFWLPGVVLVLTLLIWHVLSRNPWQIHGWVLPAMLVESLVLTVPLFVLNRVLLEAGGGGANPLRLEIVLALGAGVYEELVFRLGLITGLMLVLVDVLHVPRRVATVVVVAVAALAFAWCHFWPLGSTPFTWRIFVMMALSGGYLSVVFVGRGLGVATGCHVAYNLILLSL